MKSEGNILNGISGIGIADNFGFTPLFDYKLLARRQVQDTFGEGTIKTGIKQVTTFIGVMAILR